VLFSQLNHFQCVRLAAFLAAYLMVAGCAAHKTAPIPPMIYPATPEAALRELRGLPQSPYDRLEIITVAAEIGEQLASAIKSARQSAAQKGANALVVLQDTEFLQKVGKRTLRVRRITYLAIRRR
jgi:membrane-bound ClpP family serine protease